MFKIAHIRTIRHIFTSIMVILMLQIFTYDLVEKGEYVWLLWKGFIKKIILFSKNWFKFWSDKMVFWKNKCCFLYMDLYEVVHLVCCLLLLSSLVL
jgi:hypothetical protein